MRRKLLARNDRRVLGSRMRLRHVQTMLAIAESGSIRSAASQLDKSQSALTKQLRQMEEELGLRLFQRTSRGVVPTESGQSLLARARSIEAELQRFNQEVAEIRGYQTGCLRISVAPLAAVKILPRAIMRFRNFFPDIDIAVSSDLFGNALNGLREGQHDIVIGPYAEAEHAVGFNSKELYMTEIAVITGKNAPHAGACSLRDLSECYWIMLGNSTGAPRQRFREHFTRHGLTPPRIRLASESRLGLLSLVEEMNAVCTFPVRLLDALNRSGRIVHVPVRETLEPLAISMVTRVGQSLTPAGEKLADCIRHRADIVARDWETSDKKVRDPAL